MLLSIETMNIFKTFKLLIIKLLMRLLLKKKKRVINATISIYIKKKLLIRLELY